MRLVGLVHPTRSRTSSSVFQETLSHYYLFSFEQRFRRYPGQPMLLLLFFFLLLLYMYFNYFFHVKMSLKDSWQVSNALGSRRLLKAMLRHVR